MVFLRLFAALSFGLTVSTAFTFIAGPPTQANSSLVANPNAAIANGSAAIPILFTALDAYSNPAPNIALTLSASGGNNVFAAPTGTTDANGQYATTLTSTKAQSETITASFGSGLSVSTSVTFQPGPASLTYSSFVMSPNSTIANNSNTLIAVLTLKDARNNAIAGVLPTFTASGSATIVVSNGNTNTSGIASATYATTLAQNENAQVAAAGLNCTVPMAFVAGPPSAAKSTFTASPNSLLADGSTQSTMSVTARDAQNNLVIAAPVGLVGSGGNNIFAAQSGTTNSSGQWFTTLKSTQVQTETLTATLNGNVALTTPITFVPGAASLATSSFAASPNSQTADGNSLIVGTLTLKDALAHPLPGIAPTFTASGSATTIASNGNTNSSGAAQASYTSTLAQNENILVSAGGLNFFAPVVFVPGPIAQASSSLVASPNALPADGTTTTTLTTTARDAQGNGVSGATVALSASGSSNTFGATSGLTVSGGAFSTTLSSVLGQTQTITATIAGSITESTTVAFSQVANTTTSTLTLSPTTQTVGPANTVTATLTLKDAQSNAISGVTPTWSASGGNNTIVPSGNTNASGVATATLSSTLAQTQTLTVTAGAATKSATATFVAGPPVPATSLIFARPYRQLANNSNIITAYSLIRDTYLNPVSNYNVNFTASGSSTTVASNGNTNSSGITFATYKTGTAQNENAIAMAGSVTLTQGLDFTPTPTVCTLTASPTSAVADGNTLITLTATVKGGLANITNIADVYVAFTSTGAATNIKPAGAVTSSSGVATAKVSSLLVGANTFYANTNGIQCAAQGNFVTRTPYCAGTPNYTVTTIPMTSPVGLALADMNADGVMDLIGGRGSGGVYVALGNSNGTFASPTFYASPVPNTLNTYTIAVGDVSGDGYPDVVGTTYGTPSIIALYLGSVNGSLTAQQLSAPSSLSIRLADLDGDGALDLATGARDGSTVSLFFGTNTTQFVPYTTTPCGNYPNTQVAVGDFNGDGVLDMSVPNVLVGTMSVLTASSPGVFQAPVAYTLTNTNVGSVVVSDLDGDGHQDIAAIGATNPNMDIFLNSGTGTFPTRKTIVSGGPGNNLAIDDINGDAIPDIVVADETHAAVDIFLGTGSGNFGTPLAYGSGSAPTAIVTGDFNGDGRRDFAVAARGSNAVYVYTYSGCH